MNNPSFINPVTGQPLAAGETYSTYENISGLDSWNIFTGMSYGFPVKPLKSNITFTLNANFNSTPSKINDHLNIMLGQYYTSGVQIGSNVSENLDFTLAYNFSYSLNNNSSDIYSQVNKYLSHYARAEFKWVAWKGFTLTANGTYNQYKGITDNYNEEYSRDIEPMEGGHGDMYYQWTKQYVAAYKNLEKCPTLIEPGYEYLLD